MVVTKPVGIKFTEIQMLVLDLVIGQALIMITPSFTLQDTQVVVEVVFGRGHLVTGYLVIGLVVVVCFITRVG